MTPAQITWAVFIAAQAVVNVPFIICLLKGNSMSDAFKAVLANLVAAFTTKVTDLQAALDAANAATADAQAKLSALDAEATAEVVAATPAA